MRTLAAGTRNVRVWRTGKKRESLNEWFPISFVNSSTGPRRPIPTRFSRNPRVHTTCWSVGRRETRYSLKFFLNKISKKKKNPLLESKFLCRTFIPSRAVLGLLRQIPTPLSAKRFHVRLKNILVFHNITSWCACIASHNIVFETYLFYIHICTSGTGTTAVSDALRYSIEGKRKKKKTFVFTQFFR